MTIYSDYTAVHFSTTEVFQIDSELFTWVCPFNGLN